MALTVNSLADQINDAAPAHSVGMLQQLRAKLHGKRARTQKLFHKATIFPTYAFHDGGRKELQFNIGIESREDGNWWRHGVAFSFEPGQSLPDPSYLLSKVDCFNEWVRTHGAELSRFKMWHWASETPSPDRPPSELADDVARTGVFVFLGARYRETNVNVKLILDDFDSLLPLYEFVEQRSQQLLRGVALPEEVPEESVYCEGGVQRILVNRYERDTRARKKCIDHYGAKCVVCGFSFPDVYGDVVDGFIHVHHLTPLSEIGTKYTVDPIADLRPLCPNCHAVVHRRDPAFSVEEVRKFMDCRSG